MLVGERPEILAHEQPNKPDAKNENDGGQVNPSHSRENGANVAQRRVRNSIENLPALIDKLVRSIDHVKAHEPA